MKLIDFFSPKSPRIGGVQRGAVHSPPLMDSSACVSYMHDHEKKPSSDHLGGEVHSLHLTDSSSCLSHLHDQEKNRDEGARDDVSSQVEVVARVFFPLAPDLNTKEVSDPRQETIPAQPKRKSMASLVDTGTIIVEKKKKKKKAAKYGRTLKEKKGASGRDEEEERRNGVSTELVLLFDPYKIKKKLTESDLGNLSRLLIRRDLVTRHLLRRMSEETVSKVESKKGADVIVRDADTGSEHQLVFALWESSESYVLKGAWIKEFVKRRGLAVGDEVGIYWDPYASKFYFSLLRKAN